MNVLSNKDRAPAFFFRVAQKFRRRVSQLLLLYFLLLPCLALSMDQSTPDRADGDAVVAAASPVPASAAAAGENLTTTLLMRHFNIANSGASTKEEAEEIIKAMEKEDRTHLRVFLMGLILKATDSSVLQTWVWWCSWFVDPVGS